MRERWRTAHKLVVGGLLLALTGCQAAGPVRSRPPMWWSTVPPTVRVPLTVERLTVLYPKTYNRLLLSAYSRMAGAAFQLKDKRPFLRIIERFDLPAIEREQRFQLSGAVSDETALRVGRLLGVDSVLLFQIEEPALRDRVLARYYGDLPPFTVTSKIVVVESGEVVYHNVVTSAVGRAHLLMPHFFHDQELEVHLRTALDRGVAQTIADLRHAFQ